MLKKSLPDVFLDGAKKGWTIGVGSILPNLVMAFVLIRLLKVTGLMDRIGVLFTPVMALFDLPGQAVAVLLGAWMSMGGGVGVAANLVLDGTLDGRQATILLPAVFLMGSQVQYMGRCLGTAGVPPRHYPVMFGIAIVNAVLAMLIMRWTV